MNSAHTKGPWMAASNPSSVVGWPVVAPHATGRSVCNVTTGHEDAAANARLIAAAPELLEALERLADPAHGVNRLPPWAVGIARAAIAKARGE